VTQNSGLNRNIPLAKLVPLELWIRKLIECLCDCLELSQLGHPELVLVCEDTLVVFLVLPVLRAIDFHRYLYKEMKQMLPL
jgi:hypothetical protein